MHLQFPNKYFYKKIVLVTFWKKWSTSVTLVLSTVFAIEQIV